jgi:hypothetical protein
VYFDISDFTGEGLDGRNGGREVPVLETTIMEGEESRFGITCTGGKPSLGSISDACIRYLGGD